MSAVSWYHETYQGARGEGAGARARGREASKTNGHSTPASSPLAPAASPLAPDFTIAYFSAEFGIHESVPVYSGGLGVLSGDHLKSASDLGLPLVGVGLMYREGYFRQYLTVDGWAARALS